MKVCQNFHGVGCSSEEGAVENLVREKTEGETGRGNGD